MTDTLTADDDGMFLPVTMTINQCSDIKTNDHKELIIRLELPVGEYWKMEQAIQAGIDAHQKRYLDLKKLVADIEKGDATLTEPLTARDVENAVDLALSVRMETEALLKKIVRPKNR